MWIIRDNQQANSRLPIFYKRFTADGKVTGCEMKISALGIFRFKINGHEINEYFMPGWSNYNRYVHLCTYDLTKYIRKDNLIEVTLAEGWYTGRLGYTRQSHVYGDVEALFAELTITYKDGREQRVVTDSSWKVGESNILSASLFDGEKVDFRTPENIDIAGLPNAKEYAPNVQFRPYEFEAVKEIARFKPTVFYQENGVMRLDFGQNFAGFITFEAEGDEGAVITLRHAEVLNEDKTLYYENLRTVQATDQVILSGKKAVFDPKFTFHGFRYAEITIEGNASISHIEGVALSQDIAYGGKFECSNEIINAVYRNVLWGQKGNFISIPTDCPQRDERLGWTGDAQVFCNSAMFNGDCNRFFANYLRLIHADILPDGKIPSLVPFFISVTDSTAGVPGWADAICVIPYIHYLHYGDISVIEESLPYAEKHLNYYLSRVENGLLKLKNPFGDWLCVVPAQDTESINQCFLGLSAWLLSRMCDLVGNTEKSCKYLDIYNQAKTAFRAKYLSADGQISGDSQTAYALSLSVGYVGAEEIKPHFLRSIERAGGKLTTGFIGVKHLLPALCEIGETDLAYQIIKQTEYPSWGYTIRHGATTVWERWNGYTEEHGFETPDMNSFNHYSLGSCAEWLYSHVLGIKLSENGGVCISPSFSAELDFAKGEYRSRKGKIRVAWKHKDGRYFLTVKGDKGVDLSYDFTGKTVVSVRRRKNTLRAVLQ